MGIAALVFWVITALGGFVLLGTWIRNGGLKQQQSGATRFPAPVIFGHFALAAAGLVLWIVYVLVDSDALAWVAFVVLLPVAVLGFTMLLRWIPSYRARSAVVAGGAAEAAAEVPAERHMPVAVVVLHGLLAVVTVVLVLLVALGVGNS